MNGEKQMKKHFVEISFSVFKGAPLSTSNTLRLFSAKCFKFFFYIDKKNAFDTNLRFVSHKCERNKKERNLDRKDFKLQCFSKVFPNVGGNALFWGGH